MSAGFLLLVILYTVAGIAFGMTALAMLTSAVLRRGSHYRRYRALGAACVTSAIVATFWPVVFIYLLFETD